ncbi:MAG: 6,7-dimethyl-8-ribityllumazine synthase [Candidatus Tyrphobacter sp.]
MKNDGRGLGLPDCSGKRFGIVASRFYPELSEWLADGARRALADCRVRDGDALLFDVPGCFEIPLLCRNLIEAERFDGLVALGAVIKGATPHFDFVAAECARGIMSVQLDTGVPIGFGVLTTLTLQQAQERADPRRGDKGYGAALAAAVLTVTPSGLGRAGFRG